MGAGSSSELKDLNNKKWVVVAYDNIKKNLAHKSSPCIAFDPETCNKSNKTSGNSEKPKDLDKMNIYYYPMMLIDVKNNYYIHPQNKKKYIIENVKNNLIIKMHDIPGGGIKSLNKFYNSKTVVEWNIKNNKEYENITVYWIEQSKYTETMIEYSKNKNKCTNECSKEFSQEFTKNFVDKLIPDKTSQELKAETKSNTESNAVTNTESTAVPNAEPKVKSSGGSLRKRKGSKKKKSKKVRSKKKKRKRKNSRKK